MFLRAFGSSIITQVHPTEAAVEDDAPAEEPAAEDSEDVTDESAPEAETSAEDTQE